MLDKLEAIKEKWEDVGLQLNDPNKIADQKLYVQLSRQYRELQKIVDAYRPYKELMSNIENNKAIIKNEKDPDFVDLAKSELEALEEQQAKMESDIRQMMIPKDPTDAKNAVVEIRAGTGGDEASLFAGDLYRMYYRYFEKKKWKVEVVSESEGTVGGYKEVILEVSGDNV